MPCRHQDIGEKDGLIAIFDAGFSGVNQTAPFSHLFQDHQIKATWDFVYGSDNVFQYDEHGTEVFSVIAAYQEGTFTGGAYEAAFQLYVTEDVGSEYRIEEYNWLFAAERADSSGVDIIHSSLGYYDFDDATMNYAKSAMDGKTAVITRAAQYAADRGIVVVCSAGNEGTLAWQTITAPADAIGVLAVANVNSSGIRVASSSTGPSADGRIKPDVAALGASTTVIKSSGAVGTANGTSLAAPLVTSIVAGVWERYPVLTAHEVMDVIRKSASLAQNPNNQIGYGIPNFKAVVNYVETETQEQPFEVFPNPVPQGNNDTLTIRPRDPEEIPNCRIEFLTSSGRELFDGDISFSWLNRAYQTALPQLAPGYIFYGLHGEKASGVFTGSFVNDNFGFYLLIVLYMRKPMVAPSILAADFANIEREIRMLNESDADWIHVDVMDGVFVPNISFGIPVAEAVKRHARKPLDVHLMIVQPERYVEAFCKAGAGIISVHIEACPHLHRNLQQIKGLGCKAGIAINPHTSVSQLENVIA